jgi:ubiquitin C-terminal hydrolase
MDINEGWVQILSLFLANAALILWFRAESRSDWRHMDNKLESSKIETTQLIKAIQEEAKSFAQIMRMETKEFHERLLDIEMHHKHRTDP